MSTIVSIAIGILVLMAMFKFVGLFFRIFGKLFGLIFSMAGYIIIGIVAFMLIGTFLIIPIVIVVAIISIIANAGRS